MLLLILHRCLTLDHPSFYMINILYITFPMLYFMTLLKKNNYGLIIVILCLLLIPHGCLTLDHPSSYMISLTQFLCFRLTTKR